jgi:sodium transport system ATP-binding protein
MLVLDQVCKSFFDPGRGEVKAVDHVDVVLADGIVALVGANGAGKSTLLRMVATLLKPDSGRVVLDGLDTRSHAARVRARLGYLSTTTRMYPRFTTLELLRYAGGFFPLESAELEVRIKRMVEAFGLGEFLHQRTAGLSTGQLQRLNLARTLLPDPDLLVLDEPTTGLDVVAANQVVEAVRAARRPGRLILIATHIMREVELACDRILVLRKGRLVHDGVPGDLGRGEELEQAVLRLLVGAAPAGAAP